MTRVSKCSAFGASFSPETPAQMVLFAQEQEIPEMEKQAEAMARNATIARASLAFGSVLFVVGNTYAKNGNLVGECIVALASTINTGISIYAAKKIYDTSCYLQTAANFYPILRGRIF